MNGKRRGGKGQRVCMWFCISVWEVCMLTNTRGTDITGRVNLQQYY